MFTSKFIGFQSTGSVPLTLKRPNATGGSYIDGVWVETASTDVEIIVNIQPAGYKETMILEYADRSKKKVKVYSSDVILSEEESENGADEFEWEGDTYRVMKVLNYSMGILNHTKAIAVMKEKINEPV
jgi:hypothetical protein